MIKKTLKYDGLDGQPIVEDWYFNLSHIELSELEESRPGGLQAHLKKLLQESKMSAMILAYRDILKASVGKRSEDGKRMLKSQDISDEFIQSGACDALLTQLVTDGQSVSEFMAGIMPGQIADRLRGRTDEDVNAEVQALLNKKPDNIMSAAAAAELLGKKSETVDVEVIPEHLMSEQELIRALESPEKPKKITDYSYEELVAMPRDQFQALMPRTLAGLPRDILVLAMQKRTQK